MCGRYRTLYDPEDWSDTRLTPYLTSPRGGDGAIGGLSLRF